MPLSSPSVRNSSTVALPSSPTQQSDKLVSVFFLTGRLRILSVLGRSSKFNNISGLLLEHCGTYCQEFHRKMFVTLFCMYEGHSINSRTNIHKSTTVNHIVLAVLLLCNVVSL